MMVTNLRQYTAHVFVRFSHYITTVLGNCYLRTPYHFLKLLRVHTVKNAYRLIRKLHIIQLGSARAMIFVQDRTIGLLCTIRAAHNMDQPTIDSFDYLFLGCTFRCQQEAKSVYASLNLSYFISKHYKSFILLTNTTQTKLLTD